MDLSADEEPSPVVEPPVVEPPVVKPPVVKTPSVSNSTASTREKIRSQAKKMYESWLEKGKKHYRRMFPKDGYLQKGFHHFTEFGKNLAHNVGDLFLGIPKAFANSNYPRKDRKSKVDSSDESSGDVSDSNDSGGERKKKEGGLLNGFRNIFGRLY